MTNQEKQKEIIEKWLDEQNDYANREFGIDNVCLDGYFDLEELASRIRQQTLEEAEKCVPETGIEIENRNGTKTVLIDRQQTLSKLQALKDNSKK